MRDTGCPPSRATTRGRSASLAILALAAATVVTGAVAWWLGGDTDAGPRAAPSPTAPDVAPLPEPRRAAEEAPEPERIEPEAQPVEALAPVDESNSLRGSRRILAKWGRERSGRDRAPCTLVVIDWDDRPVADAIVHVAGDEYERRSGWDFPTQIPPVVGPFDFITDANGRCVVQLPEHGPRALAEKAGLGRSTWVQLAPSDGKDEFREILVPLRPTAMLVGQVLQADGASAPAAAVYIGTFRADPVVDLYLTADAGGRFEVAVPSLQDIFAKVDIPGQETRRHVLKLQPGERREVRLRLPGPYAIRGQVVDAAGLPYSGEAPVWVHFWPDPELLADAEGFETWRNNLGVFTDADGRFDFVIDRPARGMLTASGPIPGLSETPAVAIDAGHPQADVTLRITDAATIKGRVIDQDGSPLAGLQVLASAGEAGRYLGLTSSTGSELFGGALAMTTSKGEFVLERLHPLGVYTISVHDRMAGRLFVINDVAAGTSDVVLAGGTLAERSASVTLVVTAGDTGKRAAQFDVRAFEHAAGGRFESVESQDGSGLATIGRLRADTQYDLLVSAKGLACQYVEGVVATAEGAAVKLTLPVPATLTIEARSGGQPAPWPIVVAEGDQGLLERRVHRHGRRAERGNGDGLIELQGMDPGRYSLIVSQDGRRATAQVELAPGESRRIVVELD